MKKFVIKILLFLWPVWIIAGMLLYVYFEAKSTGEFDSVKEMLAAQKEDHEVLIGLGYNEGTGYLKLERVNEYRPEVVTLGTSRVLQFKEAFFTVPFYNCGGVVSGNFRSYKRFLQNLNYTPAVVVIGIDTWFFNDAWSKRNPDDGVFYEITADKRSMMPMLRSIGADRLSGRWTEEMLQAYPDNIGFNGRVKDAGCMYDGSYYYGDIYRLPERGLDYDGFSDSLNRIATGGMRFEWGEHIDREVLEHLEEVLSYCSEQGITVVGFLAPFAPFVYDAMQESGHYGYCSEIMPACKELFDQFGYELYDYTDGETLGVTDDCFVDGSHGSDIVYAAILADMKKNASAIGPYIDDGKIERWLQSAYSGLVFENPDVSHNIE